MASIMYLKFMLIAAFLQLCMQPTKAFPSDQHEADITEQKITADILMQILGKYFKVRVMIVE